MIKKSLGDKTNSEPYLSSQNKKQAKTKQYVYAHVEHARQYANLCYISNFQQQCKQIHLLSHYVIFPINRLNPGARKINTIASPPHTPRGGRPHLYLTDRQTDRHLILNKKRNNYKENRLETACNKMVHPVL